MLLSAAVRLTTVTACDVPVPEDKTYRSSLQCASAVLPFPASVPEVLPEDSVLHSYSEIRRNSETAAPHDAPEASD